MRDDAWWQIDQLSVPGRASSLEELGLPGERGGFFSRNGAMSALRPVEDWYRACENAAEKSRNTKRDGISQLCWDGNHFHKL